MLVTSGGRNLSTGNGGATASASCVPTTPPLESVPLGTIADLRAELRTVMAPLALNPYAWGIVSPDGAWLDNTPLNLHASQLTDQRWPASYEIRSWTPDPQLAPRQDDVAADVFMFASPGQARRFFTEASGARCHRDGVERPTSRPPQGRDLTWVNPDGVAQDDVFLLRGRRVYRVTVVRPQVRMTTAPERQAGTALANGLACALPGAGCRHGPRTT